MADDKNVYTLWHEHINEDELAEKIQGFIKGLANVGFRLDLMKVEWQDGECSARIKGKKINNRRIEDKKTPRNH